MDMVQHSFARKVAELGGEILIDHPVKYVDWDENNCEFVISVSRMGEKSTFEYRADYCFSNIAMPFLSQILSAKLQAPGSPIGFNDNFKAGLQAVYNAQFNPSEPEPGTDFTQRFLAMTTKVGWQAERKLWQGEDLEDKYDKKADAMIRSAPKSEVGVVPIYGGISWTNNEINQIWYPSNDYHSKLGVLTGAYNFQKRHMKANMPHIKGGWAQWHVVNDAVKHFNTLTQGTVVSNNQGPTERPVFFVIGDQMSSLSGWQEGAVWSALMALSRLTRPDLEVPYLKTL
eukprot:IDg13652t1